MESVKEFRLPMTLLEKDSTPVTIEAANSDPGNFGRLKEPPVDGAPTGPTGLAKPPPPPPAVVVCVPMPGSKRHHQVGTKTGCGPKVWVVRPCQPLSSMVQSITCS